MWQVFCLLYCFVVYFELKKLWIVFVQLVGFCSMVKWLVFLRMMSFVFGIVFVIYFVCVWFMVLLWLLSMIVVGILIDCRLLLGQFGWFVYMLLICLMKVLYLFGVGEIFLQILLLWLIQVVKVLFFIIFDFIFFILVLVVWVKSLFSFLG